MTAGGEKTQSLKPIDKGSPILKDVQLLEATASQGILAGQGQSGQGRGTAGQAPLGMSWDLGDLEDTIVSVPHFAFALAKESLKEKVLNLVLMFLHAN